MLDKNSIAQLSQLKQDILSSKDFAEGTVVGSSGRYGFVKLNDGRTAFLNPEKMQHVFPGDLVKVNVVKNAKEQLEAEFEEFLSSPLSRFVGQYKVKGGAHFIVPMDKSINRWIFLPPQNRIKCKVDDYVLAEVAKHPFDDGKAAAKVLSHVGSEGDNFLQHNIIVAKYGLARYWSKDAAAQAKQCANTAMPAHLTDLTQLPFVTIDSSSTKDMDDALYIEPHSDGGWQVWVAIADPASFITPGSFIAKSARYFGQTVYLPGRVLPMLPENLATDFFSLQAGHSRASLVCKLHIIDSGDIAHYEFIQAKIQSRHKLTYPDVAAFLDGDSDALKECDDAIRTSLQMLSSAAKVRFSYRQEHNIVFEDQLDYDWTLNKQGFIESITKRPRSSSHSLVEEAMVATNICAGEFLAKNKSGIFATQTGFRPERIGEVKALLREELGDSFDIDSIETHAGFMALMQKLKADAQRTQLLAPLRRFMQSTELSAEPLPHLGMGLMHYAPITSPIRRYADLCNHWSLQQILQKNKAHNQPNKLVEQLIESIENSRQASRELEQILVCEYLSRHIGESGVGTIRIVTQQGFGVKFIESGLEGFVQIPKNIPKTFDAKRMTLSVDAHRFALGNEINVKVVAVDNEKRRVKLELTDITFTAAKVDAQSQDNDIPDDTTISEEQSTSEI